MKVPLESRMRGNVPVRFGGGRLETCLVRGNAPTAYPIEEVTGSSPVAPTIQIFCLTLQKNLVRKSPSRPRGGMKRRSLAGGGRWNSYNRAKEA
jgi:hypothetical protein